jgi:hypothetical protein
VSPLRWLIWSARMARPGKMFDSEQQDQCTGHPEIQRHAVVAEAAFAQPSVTKCPRPHRHGLARARPAVNSCPRGQCRGGSGSFHSRYSQYR